nr:2-C-methyl-D-erythritol 4-phosphate cytidylyltransferase [uncultured Acetatifactor sp.]
MTEKKKRCTAIVLAAGSGSRMHSSMPKQFMSLGGRPLICHALQAVEESPIIDDCILVVAERDEDYVRIHILEKYGFRKVVSLVSGGDERYLSVGKALRVLEMGKMPVPNRDGYVFIHDGARPFLTQRILQDTYEAVEKYHACVAAIPSKDTVKIADEEGFAVKTPDRKNVWSIQTPQVFDVELIVDAYRMLEANQERLKKEGIMVTDDAGVVELFTSRKVKLVKGSYENFKITTWEDMKVAEAFLKE